MAPPKKKRGGGAGKPTNAVPAPTGDTGDWDVLGWPDTKGIPRSTGWGPRPWNEKTRGQPLQTRFVQYRAGMENAPPPGHNTPDGIAQIQFKLAAAGYLTSYRNKIWDGPTRAAYKALLTDSNINGMAWDKMLDRAITGAQESGAGAGKAGGVSLPTFDLANADDLRDVFRETAKQVIGYRPEDHEVEAMVLSYQEMQRGRQSRLDALAMQEYQANQAGGTSGPAPAVGLEAETSPADFARREFEKQHPLEAAAGKGAGQVEAALSFLRGGSR